MKTIPGVYTIINTNNGKLYIGSSVDPYKRWGDHLRELRKGSHHCSALQRAWTKYGESSFKFNVIEWVDGDEKLREQELLNNYIDKWDMCYNSLKNSKGFGDEKSIPVFQIDNNNQVVGYYKSAKECQRLSNNVFRQGQISKAVSGVQKSAYGFKWVDARIFPEVKVREDLIYGYRSFFKKYKKNNGQSRPVVVTDTITGDVLYFNSLKDARTVLNTDFRPISQGLRDMVKHYKMNYT